MLTKVNNHSPLVVSKKELTDSKSWSKLTKERFIKQHGDIDHIPEGDNHAVPHFYNGPDLPEHSEEEMEVAVGSLEEQIKQLQENERKQAAPTPTKAEKVKDDFYDDWLNE